MAGRGVRVPPVGGKCARKGRWRSAGAARGREVSAKPQDAACGCRPWAGSGVVCSERPTRWRVRFSGDDNRAGQKRLTSRDGVSRRSLGTLEGQRRLGRTVGEMAGPVPLSWGRSWLFRSRSGWWQAVPGGGRPGSGVGRGGEDCAVVRVPPVGGKCPRKGRWPRTDSARGREVAAKPPDAEYGCRPWAGGGRETAGRGVRVPPVGGKCAREGPR